MDRFPRALTVAMAAVIVGVLPSSAGAAGLAAANGRVAALFGNSAVPLARWSTVPSVDGARLQAVVPGQGIAQVSSRTGQLAEVVFARALEPRPGPIISRLRAEAAAETFAARFFPGVGGLRLRSEQLIDHRIFAEYRFTWQARRGQVWLPSSVTVGVNARTGGGAYVWSERGATDVSTIPKIPSAQAQRRAERVAGVRPPVKLGTPQLEVVLWAGKPRLVWITRVARVANQRIFLPGVDVVWTDALTGTSTVVAAGGGGGTRTPAAQRASGVHTTTKSSPAAGSASSAGAPVYASCYDALYFDGLDSRYSANHCASALSAAGYTPSSNHNVSAAAALLNASDDGVFFMAGHSIDFYANNCTPSCSGPHTAAGLLYESPDRNGNLDALAADAFYAANLETTGSTTSCSEGGGCKTQNGFLAYPWGGENPQTYKVNLAVLEACATAQNAGSYTSMANTLHAFGVGTVIGFVDDISFPVNVDESNAYGDAWANTFWSDLGAGTTYTTAAVDAANAVGNQYGFGSWVQLHYSGAPTSLYPAQYYALFRPVP